MQQGLIKRFFKFIGVDSHNTVIVGFSTRKRSDRTETTSTMKKKSKKATNGSVIKPNLTNLNVKSLKEKPKPVVRPLGDDQYRFNDDEDFINQVAKGKTDRPYYQDSRSNDYAYLRLPRI